MKTTSQILKEAHKLAKTFTGNYQACLSEAMRIVWFDAKKLTKLELRRRIEMLFNEINLS